MDRRDRYRPLRKQFFLRDFSAADLERAGAIALQIWGDEVDFIPPVLIPKVYDFLLRYYFDPDSPFNCAVTDDTGEVCGFLLAHRKHSETPALGLWLDDLTCEERFFVQIYKAYLDGNKKAEEQFLQKDEVLLLLFASLQKGCGALMMQEFERRCREEKISSILLWTDDTCNFNWYHKNNFTELCRFPAQPSLPGQALNTFIFRKNID
jgi:hypothetical protein